MSGISNIYSFLDSVKRVLGNAISDPKEFLRSAGANAAANPLTETDAMNFMPGAIGGQILFHGGPQAVTRINSELGQNLAKGPGFYLSNILNTPLNFATKGGKQSGVVSAFDIPDLEYARMLRLNNKPLNKYPELEPRIVQLIKQIPELRARVKDKIEYIKQYEPDRPANQIITGEWINQTLDAMGGMAKTPEMLGGAGIPGKTWQYSHERPAELATVVFPDYSNLLKPIEQLQVEPGIAGARAANMAMKAILGITK